MLLALITDLYYIPLPGGGRGYPPTPPPPPGGLPCFLFEESQAMIPSSQCETVIETTYLHKPNENFPLECCAKCWNLTVFQHIDVMELKYKSSVLEHCCFDLSRITNPSHSLDFLRSPTLLASDSSPSSECSNQTCKQSLARNREDVKTWSPVSRKIVHGNLQTF